MEHDHRDYLHPPPELEADRSGPPSYKTADNNSQASDSDDISPPQTPPSSIAYPTSQQSPLPIVEPQVTPPSMTAAAAAAAKRSPNRLAPSKRGRLGAIDEHSDAVSPDLPTRGPLRHFGFPHTKLFRLSGAGAAHTQTARASGPPPPKKLYDDIEGPNGEKFTDVRNNRRTEGAGKNPRRKRLIWAGVILLVIGLIVMAVLLGVLLSRRNRNRNSNTDNALPSDQSFPAGTYNIATYLTSSNTSCTSNPATWNCPPNNIVYNTSTTAAFAQLSWKIVRTATGINTDGGRDRFTITSGGDSPISFGYSFTDVLLTLRNSGTADEAYTFTTPFTKIVKPTAVLTTDGQGARCFYNTTVLSGRLYTRKEKSTAFNNTVGAGATVVDNQWPHAVDFSESITSGSNVPECYRLESNLELGERIDVPALNAVNQPCNCEYSNIV